MQHYIPYTPQQNRIDERKNRSLKDMATYMMKSKDLPPNFWVEVIKYESYIHNRVPHKHIDVINPFEAWSGHKPDLSYFRIFGSKAWARITLEKRKAMEPQSQEFIFVVYSEDSKGYNMININTKKSLIERSVQFEEEPMLASKIGESYSSPQP